MDVLKKSGAEMNLQEQINALPKGNVVQLGTQELEGPIEVDKPLTLEGQKLGATIWARKGPVVTILSEGVTLRNMRIEVTEQTELKGSKGGCAILIKAGLTAKFENVEICGGIVGLPGEEGEWIIPASHPLGELKYGKSHEFKIAVTVPVSCKIDTDIPKLEITPSTIEPGFSELRIHTPVFPDSNLLNGSIFLISQYFRRRITLTAHIIRPKSSASIRGSVRDAQQIVSRKRRLNCRIFLSYAKPDKEKVETFYQKIKDVGFSPWMDCFNLPPGVEVWPFIKKEMTEVDFIMIFLSKKSYDHQGYYQRELKIAHDKQEGCPEKRFRIVPVRLEECEVPQIVSNCAYKDLYDENDFEKLMQFIRKEFNYLKKKSNQIRRATQAYQVSKNKTVEMPPEPVLLNTSFDVKGRVDRSVSDQQFKRTILIEEGKSERRLPFYILLDSSSSMAGEPVEAVQQSIKMLLSDLRSDPYSLETIFLSIITFGSSAQQTTPLTPLEIFVEPILELTEGRTLGAALKLLDECLEKEFRKTSATSKGDWLPLVLLIISGSPTDRWEEAAYRIRQRKFGSFVALKTGIQVDSWMLKLITENVIELDKLPPEFLKSFFRWASAGIVRET